MPLKLIDYIPPAPRSRGYIKSPLILLKWKNKKVVNTVFCSLLFCMPNTNFKPKIAKIIILIPSSGEC